MAVAPLSVKAIPITQQKKPVDNQTSLAEGGDFRSMIIQQLTSLSGGKGQGLKEALEALESVKGLNVIEGFEELFTTQAVGNLKKLMEQLDGTKSDAVVEMLMQLIPQGVDPLLFIEQSPALQQLIQTIAPTANQQTALLTTLQQQFVSTQIANPQENPTSSAPTVADLVSQMNAEIVKPEEQKTVEQIPVQPIVAQSNFTASVKQAKQIIDSSGMVKKEFVMPIDLEKLQEDVDQKRYLTPTATPTSPVVEGKPEVFATALSEEVDTADVIMQIKTGITENLSLDKQEFVIKLRPEGLGEITVKMVNEGSKVALSIITSSSQVEKLISGEISSLRTALRPYNAEITQVTSSETAYAASDNNGYMFSGEQQRQQYAREHGTHHQNNIFHPEELVEEEIIQEQLDLTGLNISI